SRMYAQETRKFRRTEEKAYVFFFSSRRRHTRSYGDWSSDVCSSDLHRGGRRAEAAPAARRRAAGGLLLRRVGRGLWRPGPSPGLSALVEPDRSRLLEHVVFDLLKQVRSEERRVGKEGSTPVSMKR